MLKLRMCVSLVLLSAATAAVAADNTTAGTLDEIVVTAQKKTESIQSVPVSITLVSEDELAREGVNTLSDLTRASASLEFAAPGTSSVGGGGYIRGIGTNSFGYSAQASVGVVLDGVVLGNTHVLSLFDLARVEVLKGPQGTTFGNSVSAGVINITTNAPDPSKTAFGFQSEYASKSAGSDYGRYMIRAYGNLPLSETTAIRVTAHSETEDGVFHNTTTGADSGRVDDGFRVRLLSKPSDDLTINLIADYNRTTEHDHNALQYRIAPSGSTLAAALAACGVTPGEKNFENCSSYHDTSYEQVKGVSAQIDYNFGSSTFTSITSFRSRDTATQGDILTIPEAAWQGLPPPTNLGLDEIAPGWGPSGPQTHAKSQWSQEFRIASNPGAKLEYVAGLFALGYKDDVNEGGVVGLFLPVPLSPTATAIPCFIGTCFQNELPNDTLALVHTRDTAAFGNITYHFSDTTRGIAGLRYTKSTVSESITIDPTQPFQSISVDASKFSYRLGVQHDLSSRSMVYGTVSSGYKGPQISDALSSGLPLSGVNPEIPTSYEVGFKTSAFDNRLAIDADVFYTTIKDYQGQLCLPNAQQTITCTPTNVDGVVTKGVEVDIFGNPVKGLTLNLSGIYNPATYPSGYTGSDGTDLGGTQLTRAAKEKITFSSEYATPITSRGTELVVGADATWRSAVSIYPSASPLFIESSGTIVNARVGLKFNQGWSVYLFGRNLGSTAFPRDFFPTPFAAGGLWQALDSSDRKIVGIQLNGKF
jgi:iron complex outermembrane recepter protein